LHQFMRRPEVLEFVKAVAATPDQARTLEHRVGDSVTTVLFVRPAWARSWRCKSSRELATVSEVKRNCVRVTERGEEAWIETASRGTRSAFEAASGRASGQMIAKLLWSRPGDVDATIVRGRIVFLPGETLPCA
jgi:hypothetical protein